jgi:uncharacterized Ntn-hydrolase superfamily protein
MKTLRVQPIAVLAQFAVGTCCPDAEKRAGACSTQLAAIIEWKPHCVSEVGQCWGWDLDMKILCTGTSGGPGPGEASGTELGP